MFHLQQTSGSWEALAAAVRDMAARPGVRSLLILAAESNGPVSPSFQTCLQTLTLPVLGGVFPALILAGHRLDQGNLVLGLELDLQVLVSPALSEPEADYEAWLSRCIAPERRQNLRTTLVFVDGVAPQVGALMEAMFNTLGLHGNFIGGGAGSLVTPGEPCVITPQGVLRDVAVLALLDVASQVAVAHGWQPLAGPFEVTASDHNVILELDWEPALPVYLQAIASHSEVNALVSADSPADHFAAQAASHPFGLARLQSEFVVRDPIAVRGDGGLMCVGDVPRGALVYVMQGSPDSLLAAVHGVRQRVPAEGADLELFIDCISRAMFLGPDIALELQAVHRASTLQVGALTLGEIANSGHEYLEFHNKTAVIAALWAQK